MYGSWTENVVLWRHFYDSFETYKTENVFEQWDITETNNWIRLLFFDDNS